MYGANKCGFNLSAVVSLWGGCWQHRHAATLNTCTTLCRFVGNCCHQSAHTSLLVKLMPDPETMTLMSLQCAHTSVGNFGTPLLGRHKAGTGQCNNQQLILQPSTHRMHYN